MSDITDKIEKEDMVETYGEEAAAILIGFKSKFDDLEKKNANFMSSADAKTLMEKFQDEFGKKIDEDTKAQNEQIQKLKEQNEELKNVVIRTKSAPSHNQSIEEKEEQITEIFGRSILKNLNDRVGQKFDGDYQEMVEVKDSEWEYYKESFGRNYSKNFIEKEIKTISSLEFARGGAILLPPVIWDKLVDQAVREVTNLAQYATQMRIGSDSLEFAVVTGHGKTSWVREQGEITEDKGLTIEAEKLNLHQLATYFYITQKMLRYSSLNIMRILLNDFKESMAEAMGAAQVGGSGVGVPQGIMNTPDIPTFYQGEAGLITNFDAIRQMQWEMKATYYAERKWLMNRKTRGVLDIIKDENKQFYLGMNMQLQPQNFLLGNEIVFAEEMPQIATDAQPILLGNFRKGAISVTSTKGSLQITDPFSLAKKGIVTVTLMGEYGWKATVPEAFIKLVTSVAP